MLGSDLRSPNPVASSQLSSSMTQLQPLTHGCSSPMSYISPHPFSSWLTPFPLQWESLPGAWLCNTMFSIARFLFLSPSSLWSWSHLTPTFGSNSATDIRTGSNLGWEVFEQCQFTTLCPISPCCCCIPDTHAKESKQVFFAYFYFYSPGCLRNSVYEVRHICVFIHMLT